MMSLFLYWFPFTLLFLFRCRFRFLFPFPFLFRIPVSGFSRRPNNKRLYLVSYNVICVLFFLFCRFAVCQTLFCHSIFFA